MKKLNKTQLKKFDKLNLEFKYNVDSEKITIKDFNGYRTFAKKDLEAIKTNIGFSGDNNIIIELIKENAEQYSPNAIKEQKAADKNAQTTYCNNYYNDFDYEGNLDTGIELVKMKIRLDLTENNISKSLINDYVTRIVTKLKLLIATKQYEMYSNLGYRYDDDNKVDQNAPINYDIFYENHFADKDRWQECTDEEKEKLHYVFYDTWLDSCKIWNKDKYDIIDMGNIRNIVRSYAPVSNKDIINDGFVNWVKNNRSTAVLPEYFETLYGKWDKIDRLGLFDETKDNILLEVWDAEQSILNKHQINYILIHAFRQALHPNKYNYQHMLVIQGKSDNGKTKTIRDLFTFAIAGFPEEQTYYTEDVDIESNNWTIAPLMNRNLAIIFGERNGIGKANNNTIKKWVDKLNGSIQYQRKGENEIREVNSHCIAFITTNDDKLLNDFTLGGYDKRFHIIKANGTNKRFVENYLKTIEDNRLQIWAEIAEWYKLNNDKYDLIDLTEEDKIELNKIQEGFRTIKPEDIIPVLNDIFNGKTYERDTAEVEDHLCKEGMVNLNLAYETALKKYCGKKYKWDSRHWNYIKDNNNLLEEIGLKYVRKKIKNHRFWCFERINKYNLSHLECNNLSPNEQLFFQN